MIATARTLSIHKVIKQHIVIAVDLERSVVEQVFVDRGADAHVLLTETADMGVDVMGVLSVESASSRLL